MIYFFAGDNQFAIKKQVSELTEAFISKHGDLALERIDAEEAPISSIIDAAQSLPFLSPSKFVVIQNANDKELLEKLAEVETPESITVVVVIPKADKRTSYYKKLAKLPQFKLFEQTNAQNVPGWVVNYVKEQGGVISPGDARYLVERVGANQVLLSNELDKLLTYSPKITKDSINELTEPLPQSTVFQLLDAAFAGKHQQTEAIYKEQRVQKAEPQAILGMIAWQLHILAVVKAAGHKSADVIAKEAKINPFVVRKTQNLARKLTMADVKRLVKDAHQLDVTLKTQSINPDQAMLLYLSQVNT